VDLVHEQQRALAVRGAVRASSKARLRSATPEKTAESGWKASPAASASSRAMVVLPTPGGPQRISEESEPRASMRVSVPAGPSRWSWPTTSASARGRSRSASGRGDLILVMLGEAMAIIVPKRDQADAALDALRIAVRRAATPL
jgi:hypothetical protein